MDKISKRKLESYKRAEMVCQELRYQLSHASMEDMKKLSKVIPYLLYWMRKTGNIKYNSPKELKKKKIPDPPKPPPKRVIKEGVRIIQK